MERNNTREAINAIMDDQLLLSVIENCAADGSSIVNDDHKSRTRKQVELPLSQKTNMMERNRNITDTSHLLSIFPEEIWTMISEQIENSTDVENFSKSSPFFRNLTLSRRTCFLFRKVWGILGPIYYNNPVELENYVEAMRMPRDREMSINCTECGQSRDTVYFFSEILKLRLVCRDWRNGIDKFYQDRPHTMNLESKPRFPLYQDNLWWTGNFFSTNNTNVDDPHKFLQHFEQAHKTSKINPFLGRSVSIEFMDLSNVAFFSAIYQILNNYGRSILYCKIRINAEVAGNIECNFKLSILLSFIPHVRYLDINYFNFASEAGAAINARMRAVNPQDIYSAMRRIPLPQLTNICSQKTKNLPGPIFDQLIMKTGKFSYLIIERKEVQVQALYNLNIIPFQNLRMLKIDFHSEIEFEIFESLRVNWKLDHLDLSVDCVPGIEWQRIFSFLENEKLKKSLKCLDIAFPRKLVREERKYYCLHQGYYKSKRMNCASLASVTKKCLLCDR